ncbi:MAG: hypothetical protein HY291_16545 [Planctomycetes bacterium]|nr:hypothetical protein [Planctomycetota bacterium]
MNQRVSAGSTYYEGKFILPVLGVIVFGGLLAGALFGGWAGMPVYIAGLAASALGLFAAYINIAKRRVWISAAADHFLFEDATRAREVRYEDVKGLTAVLRTTYSEGMPTGVDVTCTVWIEENGVAIPLPMRRAVKGNAEDAVVAVMKKAQDRVFAVAREKLGRGEAVEGDGWRLSRQEFEGYQDGGRVGLSIEQITAVDDVDGNICIWRHGQDDPAVRVPVSAKNAFLLTPLIRAEMEGRKKEQAAPPAEGLGRVIFERKSGAWGWILLAILLAFMAVAFFVTAPALGVLFGLGAVGMVWLYWTRRNPKFRCCEYGVSWQQGNTDNKFRYTDIEVFTYSATRHYHNGAYTGTYYSFNFVPKPEARAKPIGYTCKINAVDDEMENLRQHIAGVIAGRMARELREGKEVRWTPNMRFVAQGLEVRAPGMLFGRKDAVVIGIHEIERLNFEKGVFYIYKRGESKAVMNEPVSTANFFPGLALLQYLKDQVDKGAGKA